MTEFDDIPAGWADEPLLRALLAPGSAAELADEERYLAAYRERSLSRPGPRSRRRGLGRLGAGGTTVVAVVALSSGVAAAYTGHLPDPVQQLAHAVIGAPPPGPERAREREGAAPTRARSHAPATPGRAAPTHTSPARPHATAAGGAGAATSSAAPTGAGSPSPSPSPTSSTASPTPEVSAPATPEPSPTGLPPAPATLTMTGSAHRVAAGQAVTLSGQVLDAGGLPLAGTTVELQTRTASGWQTVSTVTSDDSGAVTASPELTATSRWRWEAAGVPSGTWAVRWVPGLAASLLRDGADLTITVTSQGAQPGDAVELLTRRRHVAVLLATGVLDASGNAQLQTTAPARRAAYVVRLPGTPQHAPARVRVVARAEAP